jgi:riboflavin kinase/FMN adenylyltransferase
LTQVQVIDGSAAWPATAPRPVVTIGNFDGVHLGHRALLDRTRAVAAELGAVTAAYTFHPAPRDVLRPGNPISRLQRVEDRIADLGRAGMDYVIVEPFTLDLAGRDAAWFASEILGYRLRAAAVVVGWDFRFGKGRGGNVETLRDTLDVPVEQVAALAHRGGVVSSSRIRQAIAAGDLAEATDLLGRPYEVVGTVVHGDARGRELGFPTANLRPASALIPGDGVYAARVDLGDGGVHDAVVNVGSRPTFDGPAHSIEAHLLDWSGDVYGRELRIAFVARIRDEQRFESRQALVDQIRHDIAAGRRLLRGV